MGTGTEIAVSFLKEYSRVGSRGHLLSSIALRDAIQRSKDENARTLLAVKVYAEFISSLEDLGALCIAVRHRDDGAGLVFAYLTHGQRRSGAPPTTLADLFEIADKGNALVAALRLPALDAILSAVPALRSTLIPELYPEVNRLLAMCAKAYLDQDRAFVRAYNKTKHGFVVVRDKHMFQPDPEAVAPDTAWIVTDNPNYDPLNNTTVPVVEIFSVELKHVAPMIERITTIRGAVVALCDLVAELLSRGAITCADDRA